MKKIVSICAVSVSFVFSLGCSKTTDLTQRKQSIETMTEPFSQLDKNQAEKLKNAFADLIVGDSYDEIIRKVGKPNFDQELVGKKGEFVARGLTYYFSRHDKDLVNENDKVVRLILNQSNKLTEIESNVEGIKSRKQ